MKNLKVSSVIAVLLVFAACNQSQKQNQTNIPSIDTANLMVSIVEVHGMTCTGCEKTIETKLADANGIFEVKASHIDSLAKVKYDPNTISIQEISDKIAATGYSVAGVVEDPVPENQASTED